MNGLWMVTQVFSKERIQDMRLIKLLAVLILATSCGVIPKPRVIGGHNNKHLGRFSVGSEKRYEVKCMEPSGEESYIWIKVSLESSAFSREKGLWDFIGKRKRDGKVLRVISNNCSMVTEDLI